jgi:hypothetical protein
MAERKYAEEARARELSVVVVIEIQSNTTRVPEVYP